MKRDVSRKLKTLLILAFALISFSFVPTNHSDALEAQPLEKQVFSILKQQCWQCHGEAVQMSGLDLRTREAILKGGEKGPAVVPGNAEASLLYRRVAGLDKPAMPLPPAPPLTEREVASIKSWIEQGAKSEAVTPSHSKSGKQSAGAYAKGYEERAITTEDRKWISHARAKRRNDCTV